MRKAGLIQFDEAALVIEFGEIELIKLLATFPQTIAEAADDYSPAVLANYLYEVAKAYNSFYQQSPILNESKVGLRAARILISMNVAKVLKTGLTVLGINVPERM